MPSTEALDATTDADLIDRLRLERKFDEDEMRGRGFQFSVRIPMRWYDELKWLADREGATPSDFARQALRRFLIGVESLPAGATDVTAAEHGLTVPEADHVRRRVGLGDDPADVVGEVKSARVGAAAAEWDDDAKYARVTHGPNAGVVDDGPAAA